MSGETAKNAARERTRVKSLRLGFQRLQTSLPSVPRDTKLSKLDVLILATNYISHLTKVLAESEEQTSGPESPTAEDLQSTASALPKFMHPIKKWPMRSRLYANQVGAATIETIESAEASPPLSSESDHGFESDCFSDLHGSEELTNESFVFCDENIWETFFAEMVDNCGQDSPANSSSQDCEASLFSTIDLDSLISL